MKHPSMMLMTLALITVLLGACAPPAPPPVPSPGSQATSAAIANPASENCIKQGGTLSIVERGDGGQYGICTFEDNMQ